MSLASKVAHLRAWQSYIGALVAQLDAAATPVQTVYTAHGTRCEVGGVYVERDDPMALALCVRAAGYGASLSLLQALRRA